MSLQSIFRFSRLHISRDVTDCRPGAGLPSKLTGTENKIP